MVDDQQIYEALAAHLDRLPSGFPGTPSGIEIKILRKLFTPEEASLAQLLTQRPETAEAVARRTGREVEELSRKLENMSRKGLIIRLRKGEEARYMAAQFVIGIWEYHVNDLTPELIRDVNEYLPYFFRESYAVTTSQLRTIPVPTALSAEQAIMPYEAARQIILEQDNILAAPCICRKEHKMMGKGCDRPLESCLVFGKGAEFYRENGIGRTITREEALKILEEAEKSGLVLQPSNAQTVSNICTCCGCCCQILINLKRLPKPARHVASNYFAVIQADRCVGCETCLERCQMEAITIDAQTAVIQRDRCIGCGLCVPTCPEKAIHLEMKPEDERCTPPGRVMETYRRILQERMERSGA